MAEIIIGRNPLLEALKADRPINRILLDKRVESRGKVAEIARLAVGKGIPVEYVDRRVLDRQAATDAHQGVIAFAASP